jgi:16S rRNA (uracil1498-N3)-methyltransferase
VNPQLRGSAAHVFVADLAAAHVSADDQHHLARVLRLSDAEPITLSDGAGRWRSGHWSAAAGVVVPSGDIISELRAYEVTIGCAIPKGDRVELVVQKLTEIGIDRIVLFESSRSVVRWSADKRVRHLERLRRIAREASSQSRRVWLPSVDVCSFADALGLDAVVIAEPGAPGRIEANTRTVLIGPEGGYDQGELPAGVAQVGLAPTVLRVETAAIVAAAGLAAWRF